MKRIVIGEEKEYARRLSDYLNHHMSGSVHIYSITMPCQMMEEEADLYLLGRDFYEDLLTLGWEKDSHKYFLLSDQEGENCLCKWKSPRNWMTAMERELGQGSRHVEHGGRTSLIALYSPDSRFSIRDWAETIMEPGSLFLGFEDLGLGPEDVPSMAELCYYIHLHEEGILSILHEIAQERDGSFYVPSAPWFFDLLGVKEEDFQWFYEQLREEGSYRKIYVALGNAAIPSMEYFKFFDQVILKKAGDHGRLDAICERLMGILVEERYLSEDQVRVDKG